ncbi:MAG: 3-isopropylmalate dehydrogenase [Gammaproteobacteria bacterium]|nr:3-isopropylmalate dehydrogenase [Gammaproteobacteria bacterium]
MSSYTIALLDGDGIGPEIMAEAEKILRLAESRNGIRLELEHGAFGAGAWFSHSDSFPQATKELCDRADAILKGPIGLDHEQTEKIPVDMRPERGALLPLRRRFDTFANFRPVRLAGSLTHFSPLKPEIVAGGIDIMIIRELVGGLYFGAKESGRNAAGKRYVNESLEYDEDQIERIARVAFETARGRKKLLHNIHKSNVLKSSVLWNEVLGEVGQEFPEVEVRHILVDAAATYLCLDPGQFDVMVMENMFGDILSDQAGGILGSLGLMPSACLGPDKAYYEPSHGSAPDIAGRDIANPYSMIGSVAMLLDMSLGLKEEAGHVWKAMQSVFDQGFTTPDLTRPGSDSRTINTRSFGDLVAGNYAAAPVSAG